MTKNLKITITIIITFNILILNAQVKQVFQVLDFNTGKPIKGAQSELFGTKLTTDANGIATAILTNDKKGTFLPIRNWHLDGYLFFGSEYSSKHKYLQTKDTLKYYVIKPDVYYENIDKITDSLFSYWYKNIYLKKNKDLIDSTLAERTNGNTFANLYYANCFADNNIIEQCHSDAIDIYNPSILYILSQNQSNISNKIFSGEIDNAINIIKNDIDLENVSDIDLQNIILLRNLIFLNSTSDTTLISNYSKVLYEKKNDNSSAIRYIYDLNRDKKYQISDSLSIIWKERNDNPLNTLFLTPGLAECFDSQNNNTIKIFADEMLNKAKNNYLRYPCEESEEVLLNCYLNSVYSGIINKDSIIVNSFIDTVSNLISKTAENINNNLERAYYLINNYNKIIQFLEYAKPETLNFITKNYVDALKYISSENSKYTATQLQIAEFGYHIILKYIEDESLINDVLNLVYDANKKLCQRFPEMFSIRNMQVSSKLLGQAVTLNQDNSALKQSFSKYYENFDITNTHFPDCYINNYLDFNSTIEGYLTYNQNFSLTDEISNFTDELLRKKAVANNSSFYAEKAIFFNQIAEKLYSNELYEESIPYYLQSNEYCLKVIPSDESFWTNYLTNYLQMGDAHLHLKQFDKAIMTYGKIFDYGKEIPISLTPEYHFMKGSAHYYTGDAYKSQNNMKIAEKEYKLAEKEYTKAISLGNKNANATMGEMYFGKAVVAAQDKNLGKCSQLIDKSVIYYEASNLERQYQTYEKAKITHKDFAFQRNDMTTYINDIEDLLSYYKKFFSSNNNNAIRIYDLSNELLKFEDLEVDREIVCAKDMIDALFVLHDLGYNVDHYYLRALRILAEAYFKTDSVEKAITTYQDAYNVNTFIFKDTARDKWDYNSAILYNNIAECKEKMGRVIDTANKDLWYYRAIDTRDTAINILKFLAKDGDESITYIISSYLQKNAVSYYNVDMIISAIETFGEANKLLNKLYNSEYKAEVESDLIRNYTHIGAIYSDKNDHENAIKNLRTAVEYSTKAESITNYSTIAIITLIDLLEKQDKDANSAEISKLKVLGKEFRKKL